MPRFYSKKKLLKSLFTAFSLILASALTVQGNGDIDVGGDIIGNPALNSAYNNNQTQLQSASQNMNQVNVNSYARTGVVGAAGPNLAATSTVIGSPSAFSNTHLFNSPWNFTPPQILFHASKTINDGSMFNCCRIINIGASLRHGIKDRLFGIYDEREFIASGSIGGGTAFTGSVITCGLNTQLQPGCVSFVGSGHVFLEEYGTSEAALVALSRMAARNGANIVGNVNCAYAETIRSYTTSLGASFGFSDGVGADGSLGGSLGANWGTSRVKRPVQPHCSGDFYIGNANRCSASAGGGANQSYFPQPVAYRRYLPPSPPISMMMAPPQQMQPMGMPPMGMAPQMQNLQPIRGLW